MNNKPKAAICLLLINDGKTHKIAARYHDEGEAINVAVLLNKLAAPIKDGRYHVVSIDEDDTARLKKYGYFEYEFDDAWEDDLIIGFEEGEDNS